MATAIESETNNATTETPSTPTDAPTPAQSTLAGPVQKSLAETSASVPPTTTYTREPASAHALTGPTETATQTNARPVTLACTKCTASGVGSCQACNEAGGYS
jgi:hypothetical protein